MTIKNLFQNQRLPLLQPQAQTLMCARQLVCVPWVVRAHITG
jgi:hypothetical protein